MNDSDTFDCTCHGCARPQILFVHEATIVALIDNGNQLHFECPHCGHQNIQWVGTGTLQWLLSRGANHILVDPSHELLDVARDHTDELSLQYRRAAIDLIYGDADTFWAALEAWA